MLACKPVHISRLPVRPVAAVQRPRENTTEKVTTSTVPAAVPAAAHTLEQETSLASRVRNLIRNTAKVAAIAGVALALVGRSVL